MSKSLHSDHLIGADVETAFEVLSTERWPAAKEAALRDGSRLVRHEATPGGGSTLVVSRELPAGVPGFLEKLLPRDGRVVQTDTWGPAVDGVRSGTWAVDMPGAPARMGGTMRLEPVDDTSCRYVVDGEIEVKVPLIGGKGESFVVGMFDKLSAKEADVLRGALPMRE
jgi:hypothetical protein